MEAGTDLRPGRRDGWIALAVFAVALGVRLLFLFSWPDRAWPHSLWYEGDATVWAEWAGALARGDPFESGLPLRSPAVAYLLHWGGLGEGPGDFTAAKIGWCAVSALGCGLAYLAFARLGSRRAALLGAGYLVFSFASYVQAVSLNGEALYTLLLVLIVLGTHRAVERPGWLVGAGLGAAHGLAILVRAEHQMLVVLLLAFMGWSAWERGLRWKGPLVTAGVLVAVAVGVCLPWSVKGSRAIAAYNRTGVAVQYAAAEPAWAGDGRAFLEGLPAFCRAELHQYVSFIARQDGLAEVSEVRAREIIQREFGYLPEPLAMPVFVSNQGALAFALANHPDAGGGFSKAALDARFNPDPTLNPALPSHLQLVNEGYRVGLQWILQDPWRWTGLAASKLARFADGCAQGLTAHNVPMGRSGTRQAVDQFTAEPAAWVSAAWRLLLAAVLLSGAWTAWRTRRGGIWAIVILYKIAVALLFFGYARQAASILPAVAVFMGMGLDAWLGHAFKHVNPRAAVRWCSAAAVVGMLLAADVYRFTRPVRPEVHGPVIDDERWGPGAFVSFRPIRIKA